MSQRRKKPSREEEDEIVSHIVKSQELNINTVNINFKCKTENQKKFINQIKEKIITIGAGYPGSGKAQPLSALVYTPTGPVSMGSLKVGDSINGINGTQTKVTGVFPQGKKDIYKVTFQDKSEVECCLEHLWTVQRKASGNYPNWIVKSLEEIQNDLNKGIEYRIPNQGIVEFNTQQQTIHPYLLGILLAEGHLPAKGNVTLSSIDKFIIDKVKLVLPEELELKQINNCDYRIKGKEFVHGEAKSCLNLLTQESYTSINDYRVKNKISREAVKKLAKQGIISIAESGSTIPFMRKELAKLGLNGTNSYNKFIPKNYKYSSVENRYNLLKGLFDGDSYVDKSGKLVYNTSSEQLRNDVIEVVQSLGGRCTYRSYYPKYTYKEEKKTSQHLHYIICITILNPEKTMSLPRKVDRLINRKYKIKFISRLIKKIEFVRNTDAQCIMVEAKDSLYLTNNFIVTHNTFLSCAEALRLLKTEPQYRKIMLVKSVTVLKGEELGFLKGDLEEKLNPFMESFKDNFYKLIGKPLTEKLQEQGIIEVQPLTYLRGRTIDNTIIIVDEAQNISYDNMKTVLTRIGENSKIIIIGDQRQIDLRNKKESCLLWLAEKFETNDKFGVTKFAKEDQVRNPIISIIEDMFDELSEPKP